jgi:hypothetical protein
LIDQDNFLIPDDEASYHPEDQARPYEQDQGGAEGAYAETAIDPAINDSEILLALLE